jgi:hypothetical protein
MLCKECPKRDKCTHLCKKAEEYVNQDYTPPTVDKYFGNIDHTILDGADSDLFKSLDSFDEVVDYGTNKTTRRLVYELYFLDKKSVDYISCYVPSSKESIQEFVDELINDARGNKILELHFVEGYNNISNIARKLKVTRQYISAYIRKYLTKYSAT